MGPLEAHSGFGIETKNLMERSKFRGTDGKQQRAADPDIAQCHSLQRPLPGHHAEG